MEDHSLKYSARGVSASKSEVHEAIKGLDKGLFPNAFCKVLPDWVGNRAEYANVMHADTAGTKPILAYLYWKETGNMRVWQDIIQDALVMNLDDMGCVGIYKDIVISSTIGRNKHLIPGEVLTALIQGTARFIQSMDEWGVSLTLAGGETADVGDVVRTLDVGFTTFARPKREDIIDIQIAPGDVIIGVASSGQSSYEDRYNSGIGSNGLTSARHDVLSQYYEDFSESFDPNTDHSLRYCGSKKLGDTVSIEGHEYTVGNLLTSPTRTYLPILAKLIPELKSSIHGIIHCTGGAQTKVMKFVKGRRVIKDNLLPVPPVFRMIQEEAKYPVSELYQVFNMGHRLEIYCHAQAATDIIDLIQHFNVEAQIIGRVEESDQNALVIESDLGSVVYDSF